MKKAVVVFNSRFGNTKKIAGALARGMEKQDVKVDCFKVARSQTYWHRFSFRSILFLLDAYLIKADVQQAEKRLINEQAKEA